MPFVCARCQAGDCEQCIDVMRVIMSQVTLPPICHCQIPEHDGEPIHQQILDPESGDIYAPGLIVREDGSVERRIKRQQD